MSGCAAGQPLVRPVWRRAARLSSLAGRMLGRGALCRRTECERFSWGMTGANDGRRLLRDAALALVRRRLPREEDFMAAGFRTLTGFSGRWSAAVALLAASAFALLLGAAPSRAAPPAPGLAIV